MKKIFTIAAFVLLTACTKEKAPEPAPALAPVVVAKPSDSDKVTEQEKRYIIARYEVENNTKKRWPAFRALMDLAVAEFEPAKEYYLSIRESKPVLPGESKASFSTYADAVKFILERAAQKIKTEEDKDCSKSNFALLDTRHVDAEGMEEWTFDYCEEKVLVTVKLTYNQETGGMDWQIPSGGIALVE